MSKTGYASWEQGLSQPSIEQLKLLCNIFEVSADYLIGLEE
jgi:transcriptional regulator with XRE-family HTH domain